MVEGDIISMLQKNQSALSGREAIPMAKYEVTVYNTEVRKKVEAGEHHDHWEDDWADFRYIDVRAENEDKARAQVEDRYPPDQGFVIDSVIKDERQE